jgi:hypothetical protein
MFGGGTGSRPDSSRARPVDARQAVELAHVEIGIVDGRDRAGVVEERLRVAALGREAPLERHVLDGVAVVVDVDLVEDVGIEQVEVRAAVGRLERDVVGDQRHHVPVVRVDERVDVGVVGGRVERDERGFAMARGLPWTHRGRHQQADG